MKMVQQKKRWVTGGVKRLLSCMLMVAMLFGMAPGAMEVKAEEPSLKEYNKPNPSYSFTTIDDQIVTSTADGKPKVLIFFSTKCGYSRQTISNIANSDYDFSGVDIIAPEINFADKEALTTFKTKYGSDAITFAYSIDGENTEAVWKYAEGGGTMPFIAYIDSSNQLRCVTKGALSAETFIANIEKYCMANSGGNTDGSTGGDNNSGNTDSSESTSNLFYSFITIDDQIVTSKANGKPKVLIFFSTKCGYSRQTISNIANSKYNFSSVDIIAPEMNFADKEAVTAFKNTYGSDAITFSYSIDGENYTAAMKYSEGGGTMPFIAYIDSNNRLQHVSTGPLTEEEIIDNIKKYCLGNTDGSTGGDNNGSTGGNNNGSTGGDNNNSTGGNNNGSTGGDNNSSTGGDNNGSIGGDNNSSPGADSGVIEGSGNDNNDSSISYGTRIIKVDPTTFNTMQLTWDAVPSAKSYEIFYSTSQNDGYKRLTNTKKTSYKFSKAKCGVTYYFQMRVCVKGAKSEFGPVSYGRTDLTGTPTLQVKKTTYNSVSLKWNKVPGAKKYEIYYMDSINGGWQSLGLKGGTSFTHKKLVTGATYYYQIRPVRDSFYGSWSNDISASTILSDVARLKVKAASTDRMKLTWKKVKGATQYVILRSEQIDGTYEVIGHSPKASYMDTGLQGGTTYFYKVYAVSGPYRTKETAPVGQMTKIPKVKK
jgi:fibronectin type 3 domain-containing protein/thiol-disulfide isomerase/thioredoxin